MAIVRCAEEMNMLVKFCKEYGYMRSGDEQVRKSTYLTTQDDLKDNMTTVDGNGPNPRNCRPEWSRRGTKKDISEAVGRQDSVRTDRMDES